MKETDYYPKICEKFSKYLMAYLPEKSEIKYSINKALPQMILEIRRQFYFKEKDDLGYIPKLKLDILFGIKIPQSDKIYYLLLEVKYLSQLGLSEYSQLSGYLQVAQNIKIGILFLVMKPKNSSALSNEFSEIINTHNLPMKWKMVLDSQSGEKQNEFNTFR